MNSVIQIPVWVLFVLMGGMVALLALDGWRARMWSKFAKQMGFPVPQAGLASCLPANEAFEPADRDRVEWLLDNLVSVERVTDEDWYLSFYDNRQNPPCTVVARGSSRMATLDAAVRGDVRKCGE